MTRTRKQSLILNKVEVNFTLKFGNKEQRCVYCISIYYVRMSMYFVNVFKCACKVIEFFPLLQGNKCPRNCILLRHCPLLLQTLRNRLPGARAAIRRNICGYDNFNIKVKAILCIFKSEI